VFDISAEDFDFKFSKRLLVTVEVEYIYPKDLNGVEILLNARNLDNIVKMLPPDSSVLFSVVLED
jgi:hypothetical protein